jgi:flagellar basal-body rod protein FlgF
MLRGIQSAAAGMIALQRKQEALTNNLANIDTPGFKKEVTTLRAFPKMLLERINDLETKGSVPKKIGTLSQGVYAQENIPIFLQGDVITTNRPFDVAIEDANMAGTMQNGRYIKPSVMFTVQDSNGNIRYTRNGRFTVNESGELTTAEGYKVLNSSGQPISHPELANGDVQILETGDIILHSDKNERKLIGRIRLAYIENPNELIKEGNDVYRLDGANPPEANNMGAVHLRHKMVERANVDPAQTMSEMMVNMRLYEANQKVIQTYDRTLEQLNTIGRL